MKLNKILTTAAVAIAAAVSANAATYSTGNLILGIYDSTGTVSQTLEFNLGAYSSYAGGLLNGSTVLNLNDELINVFGEGWATNTNLKWGLAAQTSTLGQKFAFGLPETTTLTYLATPAQVKTGVNNYASKSAGYAGATTVEGDGYLLDQATATYNLKTYDVSGDDFGSGADIIVGMNSNRTLDLYYFNAYDNGVYQDVSFQLTDSGDLLAVPEPSTYAMMALGGLGLLRMFRRRSVINA